MAIRVCVYRKQTENNNINNNATKEKKERNQSSERRKVETKKCGTEIKVHHNGGMKKYIKMRRSRQEIQVFWWKLNQENKTKEAELAELGHRVVWHCGHDGRWLVESVSREESGVYRFTGVYG